MFRSFESSYLCWKVQDLANFSAYACAWVQRSGFSSERTLHESELFDGKKKFQIQLKHIAAEKTEDFPARSLRKSTNHQPFRSLNNWFQLSLVEKLVHGNFTTRDIDYYHLWIRILKWSSFKTVGPCVNNIFLCRIHLRSLFKGYWKI